MCIEERTNYTPIVIFKWFIKCKRNRGCKDGNNTKKKPPPPPPAGPPDDYGKDKYAMKAFKNKELKEAFQDFKKEKEEQIKMLEEDPFEQKTEKRKAEKRKENNISEKIKPVLKQIEKQK